MEQAALKKGGGKRLTARLEQGHVRLELRLLINPLCECSLGIDNFFISWENCLVIGITGWLDF